MTPHIYLDVDGVLNAFPASADPGWGWGHSEYVTVNRFGICYSPAMVEQLNDLAEHAKFHWLTTWRHDAPRLLAPAIGLNGADWPVIDVPDTGLTWWKLTAMRRQMVVELPTLAFWIDDDIKFDRDAHQWATDTERVIPVSPRTEVGLTVDHLTHIRTVIEEHAA